jgi:hypothetical protein
MEEGYVMGKLVHLIMSIIAVQLVLFLFFDVGFPLASVWQLFLDPTSWSTLSFSTMFSNVFSTLSVGAFVGGMIFNSEILVFAGLAGTLYTFGQQLSNLWQQIAGNAFFGGVTAAGGFIASILCGALIVLYIFTVIEWWRGRD